jgi:hypothetical protein
VTYCDRAGGVVHAVPLGGCWWTSQAYWVYQISSWRDELYSVSSPADGVSPRVVAIAGGGCPKDAIR